MELPVGRIEDPGGDQRGQREEQEVQSEEVNLLLDPLAKTGVGVMERIEQGHARATAVESDPREKVAREAWMTGQYAVGVYACRRTLDVCPGGRVGASGKPEQRGMTLCTRDECGSTGKALLRWSAVASLLVR